MTALLFEEGGPAFLPGILVSSNNHGACILPKVEDQFPFPNPVQQSFLQGKVFIGIASPAPADQQLLDHAFTQRTMGFRAAATSSGRPI